MTEEEKILIEEMFIKYNSRIKKTGNYTNDFLPWNLIKLYFFNMEKLDSKQIATNYRKKYIKEESILEGVHSKEEKKGLGVVYDFILDEESQKFNNIYILLQIHQKLFSKTKHPEIGGNFRQVNTFIADSTAETADYTQIPKMIAELNLYYQKLLASAYQIGDDPEKLQEYINNALKLKCRLIKIHPFQDGNGRTCRALINILFRHIGLPPVYVEEHEKEEYCRAMDEAIVYDRFDRSIQDISDESISKIRQFYLYKLCNSICELDIKEQEKRGKKILK